MKKILTLLVITTALSLGVYAQQPLTQFLLVEVLDNDMGVSLRDEEDMARRLRRIASRSPLTNALHISNLGSPTLL